MNIGIVQRHLQRLVVVLVVAVVDDVHRVDVEARQPIDGDGEALHHRIERKRRVRGQRRELGTNLRATNSGMG